MNLFQINMLCLFVLSMFLNIKANGQNNDNKLPTGLYELKADGSFKIVNEFDDDTLSLNGIPFCDISEFKHIILDTDWNNDPIVWVELNEKGKKELEETTERNIGKKIGIIVDGQMLMAPTIQGKISGGKFSINTQSIAEAVALKEKLDKEISDLDKGVSGTVQTKIIADPPQNMSLLLACNSLDNAFVTKDTLVLNQVLDDHLIYVSFYRKEYEKDILLNILASGYLQYEKIAEERKPTFRFSKGMASAIRYMDIKGKYRTEDFEMTIKVLEVWVYENKHWELFARQDLKIK